MPTASSSARRVLAAFAAAAAAALAAVRPASGEPGQDAPGTETCKVCHTDARYSRAFSHRGLEDSAEGCLTCHGDGTAHVKARGGKGSVVNPATGKPAAERELCVTCHEEKAEPKHLEPKPKDARCSTCHTLHGAAKPVREKAGGGPGPAAPPPPPSGAPERGRAWARGTVQAGWRFVGGEEGRYEEDVNLDDGPRLLGLDVQGGLDDRDPLAATAQVRVTGFGDPHESAMLRARRSDLWRVTLSARRDELPFLGQNGLHGGETLRTRSAADADLRASDAVRIGLGFDRLRTEGEIRGTAFDSGTLIPVAARTDRIEDSVFASAAFRGKAWHASVRQGWTWETGEDSRDRDRSVPGTPDSLLLDDDSTMTGPATSALGGVELLDGRLSLEARASRTALGRDVDTEEVRRGVLGSTPFTRRTDAAGERDRLLLSGGLDASFAFRPGWSAEAALDARSFREEGDVLLRESLDTGSGPSVTTTVAEDRVSQRVLSESLALRRTFEGGFTLRGGVERETDRLHRPDGTPPQDETVRTSGLFLAAEGRVSPEWTLRAEAHRAHGSDQFTPLTPRDRQTWRLGAAYREPEAWRWGGDWQYVRLEARDSDLGSSGNALRLWGGFGKPDDFTADLSWTIRQQTLMVDAFAFTGSTLSSFEPTSKIRAHVVDLRLGAPLSGRLRFVAGGTWALDRGSLPVRALDVGLGLRWEVSKALAAIAEVRRREYDEVGADALDYEADILQLSFEYGF